MGVIDLSASHGNFYHVTLSPQEVALYTYHDSCASNPTIICVTNHKANISLGEFLIAFVRPLSEFDEQYELLMSSAVAAGGKTILQPDDEALGVVRGKKRKQHKSVATQSIYLTAS